MLPMSWLQLPTEAGLAAAAVALEDERKRRLLMKVKQQTMLSAQGHQSFHDSRVHHNFGSSFAIFGSDTPSLITEIMQPRNQCPSPIDYRVQGVHQRGAKNF